MPTSVSPAYLDTRDALHRVATHVLARARAVATGRFGLRPSPGGFATPAFGAREEVLRVGRAGLVREWRDDDGVHTEVHPLDGATLRGLAGFAAVDLGPGLDVGKDTPALADPDAPLSVDAISAAQMAAWFWAGACALDLTVAARPASDASVAQLWPEHFDLGIDVAAGPTRVNLGVSPGDGFHAGPYAYVGPWGDARPGDPGFWNAPFGAVLAADDPRVVEDAVGALVAFFARGLSVVDG